MPKINSSIINFFFLLVFSFLFSCKPAVVLTSRPNIPHRPHVALRNGDTLFGNEVAIGKRRFPRAIVTLDSCAFPFDSVRYFHTAANKTFYIIPPRKITEQVVFGKMNVFANVVPDVQRGPKWRRPNPDEIDKILFLQKWPDEKLYKYSFSSLDKLVADNNPAAWEAYRARSAKNRSIAFTVLGGIVAVTGFVLFFGSLLGDQENFGSHPETTVGAVCIPLGALIVGLGLPLSLSSSKYHRDKAIQLYNAQ
ncbi:MAG: hypothetical protein ABI378_09245 [Chitinophagaceae bacterium]